jgi:15-hydroxyprostaglandin dehydrogenase (NAD)
MAASGASEPVALITGAASGMGLALSIHLLSRGWRVGLCDRNALSSSALSSIEDAQQKYRPRSTDKVDSQPQRRSFFRAFDITSYDDQARFFRDVFDWGGHIDYVALNAGIVDNVSLYTRPDRMPIDPATQAPRPINQSVIDIDLKAVIDGIWLYRYFASKLTPGRGGGKITVTASVGGFYAMGSGPQYAAAKHGCIGIVRATSGALKRDGITINAVCPSFVHTSLLESQPDFLKIWPKEHLVPMDAVIKVHDTFIDDDGMTGQTVEVAGEKGEMFFRKPIDFSNESTRFTVEDGDSVVKKVVLGQSARKARL